MENLIQHVTKWFADPVLGKITTAAIYLLIVVSVVKLVQRTATRYVEDKSTRYRARKAIAFVGYLIGFLGLGVVFSDRLSKLTVVLGVAGAGIAFALQEVIASMAGWIAISFGGFYKVGDRVELGGIKGDVIDIGILRTTLAELGQWIKGDLYNGRVVRVANSFIFKEPVFNYSGDFPFLWDEVTVPIRFGSDLAATQKLLEEVASEVCDDYAKEADRIWERLTVRYPLEKASTAPLITMVFDENWVTFTVRYTVRFDKRRSTRDVLSAKILQRIDASKGAVSIAAAAMEIFPKQPLDVRQIT
jgi:small-conductance mechanosensitive channel